MSNLKPNTNEIAQVVVDKLNNTCQICHSKLDDDEKDVCQVCRVNLLEHKPLEFRKGYEFVANVSKTRSYQDQTLIDSLKSIAKQMQTGDGIASIIYEAAQRLEELT